MLLNDEKPASNSRRVRHRRRPRRLRDLLPFGPHVAGLGRRRRGAERDPVVAAVAAPLARVDERRPGAVRLVVVVEPHLVPRRELTGQADRFDLLGRRRPRLHVRILHVVPLRRVAGVRVGVETGNVLVGAVAAQVVEEPQPVALDRTAEREVRVPVLDQARRLRDADAAQVDRRDCSPCDHLPAVLTNAVPLNVLPPVLGMMLNAGPPRSLSPMPPATVTWTSCAFTNRRQSSRRRRRRTPTRRSCRRPGPCLRCRVRRAT